MIERRIALTLPLFYLILIATYGYTTLNAEIPNPSETWPGYEMYSGDDDYCCPSDDQPSCCFRGHIFALGPEFYHIKRTREGGTRQSGNAIGVRANYDHIKRYKIYWGGQAFYGSGILKGHALDGDKIRSRFTDRQIEGSLGYTFAGKEAPYFSFTPYVGYGYFWEKNKFLNPSPLLVTFTTRFPYMPFGFLSSAMINPCFKVGLNARFKYLWNPKCKISGDADFEDVDLQVGEHIQYRIELPVGYFLQCLCNGLEITAIPFYERRWYGGKPNFPFDFAETKLKIYGLTLQLVYQF
jgi:hypothetical protein